MNFLTALLSAAQGSTTLLSTAGASDMTNALTLLWQGMVGIFSVMVLIALIVYLLSKIGNRTNK